KMGYRIAVDDLGAGYAGLTSFTQLEPHIVKLDMSLIRGVHEEPTKRKLVSSIVDLCEDLGISVVAEGVETLHERDALEKIGCPLLQGYLFGKPDKPFSQPRF
ncbi:MAG: EAL domain-containing protein, partial [Myxococcales bacterium]